jgi:hypothetical protein
MSTACNWCEIFDSFVDAHALSSYLTNDSAQLAIDTDTLDALIDGAKACRHASDLQTNIDTWERQLTHQRSLQGNLKPAESTDERLSEALAQPSPVEMVEWARRARQGGLVGYDEHDRLIRLLPGGTVEVLAEAEGSYPGNTLRA